MERTGHIQNQALILVCFIVGINAHDVFGLLVTRDPYRQYLSVTDTNLFNSAVMSDNHYDHRHRRVTKKVYELSGFTPPYGEPPMPGDPSEWGLVRKHTYFYDGWNLVLETVAHTGGSVDRIEYVWGLDLSGTLQGAGGVGGLLFEVRNGQIFIPLYDANGNVTAFADANGNVRAEYVYDVFGNTASQAGDMADVFRFRFSTKYYDVETQSYYYGYRHYAPKLGCWLSKDPIGERGGLNLYGFLENASINKWDYIGMFTGSFTGILIEKMPFSNAHGAVNPSFFIECYCKCKKIKCDLSFFYTMYIRPKTDTIGWQVPTVEHPGEPVDQWSTWSVEQKYAMVLQHERKHVYWYKVFYDGAKQTVRHHETMKFSSDIACNSALQSLTEVLKKGFVEVQRKQHQHQDW